jgi:SdrD B-like domain
MAIKYTSKLFGLLFKYSIFVITVLAIISPGIGVFAQAKPCLEREVLIQGKCVAKNFSIFGYVYYDKNGNEKLDSDDYNHPVKDVEIFSNQTSYCPPTSCGYTTGQFLVKSDKKGKFTLPSGYGLDNTAVLFSTNYIQLTPQPKNISIPPAEQATIRSEKDNTFETPFLVRKKDVVKMAKISGKVFLDKNADGIYNKGDEKREGLIVRLVDVKTKKVVRELRIEGIDGYKFEVPQGKYYVEFEESDAAKWSPTPQNIGFDKSVDSDINSRRRTAEFELKADKELINIDAGFVSNLDPTINPEKLVAIEIVDRLIKSFVSFFNISF